MRARLRMVATDALPTPLSSADLPGFNDYVDCSIFAAVYVAEAFLQLELFIQQSMTTYRTPARLLNGMRSRLKKYHPFNCIDPRATVLR